MKQHNKHSTKQQTNVWNKTGYIHIRLTMYYIRLLLYDIVIVTLRLSHGFSTKCIGYHTMCIGVHWIWLRKCTNAVRILTNTLCRETATKSVSNTINIIE